MSARSIRRIKRCLIANLFFCWLLNPGSTLSANEPVPLGEAVRQLPLFDAHMHYNSQAWTPYPVATVLSLMDRSGVAMALVSSTPDAGTVLLWEYAPLRTVPELRPYHDAIDPTNWSKAPDMMEYLQQRMEKYPHQGIGEFHIHRIDPNDLPFLKKIVALAKAHQAVIHLHANAEPVEVLFRLNPSLTIIWAHAGMSEEPDVIGAMMARYEGLYADTSYREYDIMNRSSGAIRKDWFELIMAFADRFMIGSDTWSNAQWKSYQDLIETNRRWLKQFPRDVAEQVAYRNAERLFGREVSRESIGAR